MYIYEMNELLKRGTKSFHVFSEKYIRGEIERYDKGQKVESIKVPGNLLLIIFEGKVSFEINEKKYELGKLSQCIFMFEEIKNFEVLENCVLELIWSPGVHKFDV